VAQVELGSHPVFQTVVIKKHAMKTWGCLTQELRLTQNSFIDTRTPVVGPDGTRAAGDRRLVNNVWAWRNGQQVDPFEQVLAVVSVE
jgi:hypothetical protein